MTESARVSKLGAYVEITGNTAIVSKAGTYVEIDIGGVRASKIGAYVEIQNNSVYVSLVGAYAEIRIPQIARWISRKHAQVIYDNFDLSSYLNEATLEAICTILDKTSYAANYSNMPGMTAWTLRIGGQWIEALDSVLSDELIVPADLKTLQVAYGYSTYLWAERAFILRYSQLAEDARGVVAWKATLFGSGWPVVRRDEYTG